MDLVLRQPSALAVSLFLLLGAARANAGAAIQVTPSPIDFGQTPAFMSTTVVMTIANVGDADLRVWEIDAKGADATAFTVSLPLVPLIIAAGKQDTLSAIFTPTLGGHFEAWFAIQSNDVNAYELDVPLVGDSPSPLGVTPRSIDFGQYFVGALSDPQPVRLVNSGGAPIAVTLSSSNPAFTVDSSASNLMLAPGESTEVEVTFVPPALGDLAATVTVAVGPQLMPAASIAVTGVGIPHECRCPPPSGCALGRTRSSVLLAFLVAALAILLRLRPGRPRAS
jgi:hypothetical protein